MSEQPYIASIRFSGVHGHQLLRADFKQGLNILHGKNGTGKTTLLHILANVLEGDLERFNSILFERLIIRLSDGTDIRLEQTGTSNQGTVQVHVRGRHLGGLAKGAPVPDPITSALKQLFPKRPVYLPAFRSILEAASSREEYRTYHDSLEFRNQLSQVEAYERRNAQRPPEPYYPSAFGPYSATAVKTVLSRHWFGDFVPVVRYPSLADVSQQLTGEAHRAYVEVNQFNQTTFATVFNDVLNAMQKGINPQTREEVDLLKRVQERLRAFNPATQDQLVDDQAQQSSPEQENSFRTFLEIYDKALAAREDKEAKAYSRLRVFEKIRQ